MRHYPLIWRCCRTLSESSHEILWRANMGIKINIAIVILALCLIAKNAAAEAVFFDPFVLAAVMGINGTASSLVSTVGDLPIYIRKLTNRDWPN